MPIMATTTQISTILTIVVTTSSALLAQNRRDYPDFIPAKDLLLAHYDGGGDPDDTQCQAAFGCLKAHPLMADAAIHGVLGATSGWSPKDNTPLFNLAFGEKGVDWSHCRGKKNWQPQVYEVRDKIERQWSAFPQANVWIAEGGHNQFTLAVIDSLLALKNPSIDEAKIKSNVHIVQHSSTNEKYTGAAALSRAKELCTYVKIGDGNRGGNGTPDYESNGDDAESEEVPFHRALLNSAMSELNTNEHTRDLWIASDNLIDNVHKLTASYSCIPEPRGAMDYSDHVAATWILSPGKDGKGIGLGTYYSIEAYFHCYVLTGKNPTITRTTRLEAENDVTVSGGNSILVGGAVARDKSASEGSYISQKSGQPLKVSWAFNTSDGGSVNLTFGFKSKDGSARKLAVLLNGAALKQNGSDVVLQTDEQTWQERTITASDLPTGLQVVEVREIDNDALDIDFLEIAVANVQER